MNTQTTQTTHATPSAQVYLHPAAATDRNAIRRIQMRHQLVFQIQGKLIVAVPANDLPGGGDAA